MNASQTAHSVAHTTSPFSGTSRTNPAGGPFVDPATSGFDSALDAIMAALSENPSTTQATSAQSQSGAPSAQPGGKAPAPSSDPAPMNPDMLAALMAKPNVTNSVPSKAATRDEPGARDATQPKKTGQLQTVETDAALAALSTASVGAVPSSSAVATPRVPTSAPTNDDQDDDTAAAPAVAVSPSTASLANVPAAAPFAPPDAANTSTQQNAADKTASENAAPNNAAPARATQATQGGAPNAPADLTKLVGGAPMIAAQTAKPGADAAQGKNGGPEGRQTKGGANVIQTKPIAPRSLPPSILPSGAMPSKSAAENTTRTPEQGAPQDSADRAGSNAAATPQHAATAEPAASVPTPPTAPAHSALIANGAGVSFGVQGASQSATSTPVAASTPAQPNDTSVPLRADALALAIGVKSQDGVKHFDIRLDPPDLGRVEVRLSVDNQGKAQASLAADSPQTLQLLQNDAPNLARALRDAGLDLANSGLSFSLKGQERQGDGNAPARSKPLPVRPLAGIDGTTQSSALAASGLALSTAGIDIHV